MFALSRHPVSDTLPRTGPCAERPMPSGNTRCAYLLRIAQKRKKNRHGTKNFTRGSAI
jgi:hypothetical protein